MPRSKPTGLLPAEAEHLRQDRLLDIAAEVFFERGYERASTAEMARRASASKQTFYTRFESKEKLFLAVIDHRTSKLPERFKLLFRGTEPIKHVLIKTAHALFSVILSVEHVQLLRIVYMEAPQLPEAARLLLERGPDQGLACLAEYLKLQPRSSGLCIEDGLLAAQQFSGIVVGDLVHRALLGPPFAHTSRTLKTRIQTSVDAFLKIHACS